MLKKISMIIMALILIYNFSACSKNQQSVDSATKDTKSSSTQSVTENGTTELDWQAYKGTKLYFLTETYPNIEFIKSQINEFTEKTDIQVDIETLPLQQAAQKRLIMMSAGGTDMDVFYTNLQIEKKMYYQNKWYLDLKPLLDDPKLTDPGFNYSDFFENVLQNTKDDQEYVICIPVDVCPTIFYYRKDIFEKEGIQPPKTLQEITEIAKKLNNPPDMYGFVNRGMKNANVPVWSFILRSMGGNYFAEDGVTPTLNSEAAIRATEWFGDIMKNYAPPGVIGFNWTEATSLFAQGNAAMSYDGSNFVVQFEDPQKSKVVGKVGYMLLPPDGVTGNQDRNNGMVGLSISYGSRNKEASWLFIQWATGPDMTLRTQLSGLSTLRASIYESEEYKNSKMMPVDWTNCVQEALRLSKWNLLPDVNGVQEYRDILGIEIQNVIGGVKDARTAMNDAQKNIEEFMKKDTK